jgi:hypothetical protein
VRNLCRDRDYAEAPFLHDVGDVRFSVARLKNNLPETSAAAPRKFLFQPPIKCSATAGIAWKSGTRMTQLPAARDPTRY